MDRLLNQLVLDNPIRDYLLILSIILVALLFRKYISAGLARLIYQGVTSIWPNLDRKQFTNLVAFPLRRFMLILVTVVSLHKLKFPGFWNISIYNLRLQTIFVSTGTLILIIAFTWMLVRVVEFIALVLHERAEATHDQSDNQLVIFFKDFFKVIIGILGVLLVLKYVFGYQIGNLVTGLSIVGAAVALALRESLENLIASFVIFFDKPFTTGDTVKVHSITGTVERIGLRSTRIRTDQKTYTSVPNKQMVDSIVDNLSLRTQHKAELRLEIELLTTAAKVEALTEDLRKILDKPIVLSSTVYLSDIRSQSFLLNIDYFTSPVISAELIQLKQSINLEVLQLLERSNIRLAGAIQEVAIISQPK